MSPFRIWLKELNFSKKKKHDSQNWTVLFNMTQRIEPFFFDQYMTQRTNCSLFQNMTQRIEPSFQQMTQRIETFSNQRIEPFFFSKKKYDYKNWTFFNMTQRIEYASKDWTFFLFQFNRKNWKCFLICLKELNPLFQHVSMNWTFF